MFHTMYWLDFESDRIGLEVMVNGFPAEYMMLSHGGRLPINEFLVSGVNRVDLRRGLWQSNKEDSQAGDASLKLVKARFQNATLLEEQVILDQSGKFAACPPRTVLLSGTFDVAGALAPPASGFEPVGPMQQAQILDKLEQIAAMWRVGDAAGLIDWMGRYLDDYVRAYPLETRNVMEERIARMVEAFRDQRLEFDRSMVLLDPLPGTNLVNCLGPEGAAVRISRARGPAYNMWAVVGIRNSKVVLVR